MWPGQISIPLQLAPLSLSQITDSSKEANFCSSYPHSCVFRNVTTRDGTIPLFYVRYQTQSHSPQRDTQKMIKVNDL